MFQMKHKFQVLDNDGSLLCIDVTGDKCVVGGDGGRVVLLAQEGQGQIQVAQSTVVRQHSQDDISSVSFGTVDHQIYCASGKDIYLFDARNLTTSVSTYSHCTEDVNQVVVSNCGKYLLSADDGGRVTIVDLSGNTGNGDSAVVMHDNVCYTLQTRPNKSCEVVSGGYDCNCIRSDFLRRKTLQRFDMAAMQIEDGGNHVFPPFINPPYVLSVGFSQDGALLAAGLQNGSIRTWDASGDKLKNKCLFPTAHTSLGVTQVVFVDGGGHVLVTGGNDGHLKAWDVLAVPDCANASVDHGAKINWLKVAQHNLYVCDVGPFLSIYNLC